jgi:hypothetical protein
VKKISEVGNQPLLTKLLLWGPWPGLEFCGCWIEINKVELGQIVSEDILDKIMANKRGLSCAKLRSSWGYIKSRYPFI